MTSSSYILLEKYHDNLSLIGQENETSNPVDNPKALPQVKGTNFSFLSSSLSSLPIVLAFIVHSLYTVATKFVLSQGRYSPNLTAECKLRQMSSGHFVPQGAMEKLKGAGAVEDRVDDRQLFVRTDFGVRMIFLPPLSPAGRCTQTLGGIR